MVNSKIRSLWALFIHRKKTVEVVRMQGLKKVVSWLSNVKTEWKFSYCIKKDKQGFML